MKSYASTTSPAYVSVPSLIFAFRFGKPVAFLKLLCQFKHLGERKSGRRKKISDIFFLNIIAFYNNSKENVFNDFTKKHVTRNLMKEAKWLFTDPLAFLFPK